MRRDECRLKEKISAVAICTMLFALCASASAQQSSKIKQIVIVSSYSGSADQDRINAFRKGLRELGYTEGTNVVIEYRRYGGLNRKDREAKIAADLPSLRADVIVVSGGSNFTREVKQANATIPIVMTTGSDPISGGLISSLARPGGNLTGLTSMTLDLSGKRLELLKEGVPNLSRVAVLYDGSNPAKVIEFKEMQATARDLRIEIQSLDVRTSDDFENAFKAAARARSHALMTLQNPLTVTHLEQIADLALKGRLPMMVAERGLVEVGGMMSYGPEYSDLYRRAATYVDKILKGAKPVDLPVEQPTKFELVINLKTAKQIGLTIPPNVLARADKVIK
jgi:putative tryptophan/tyrosine transport system substrate-binding protein